MSILPDKGAIIPDVFSLVDASSIGLHVLAEVELNGSGNVETTDAKCDDFSVAEVS